jgi:hypothetical protein
VAFRCLALKMPAAVFATTKKSFSALRFFFVLLKL